MSSSTKQKISQSRKDHKPSATTRRRMSDSKKLLYRSDRGKKLKIKQAKHLAKYRRVVKKGYKDFYHSPRLGKAIFFASRYELRAIVLLDKDKSVVDVADHFGFVTANGQARFGDFLATHRNGRKKMIEVKPRDRLDEFADQIEDGRDYAAKMGYDFEVWTEKELGFDSHWHLATWALETLSRLDGVDYLKIRRDRNNAKARRHYQRRLSDTGTFDCEVCGEQQLIRLKQYEKTKSGNDGLYICHNCSARRPKFRKQKVIPYADSGRKKCSYCKTVKAFAEFGRDKSRSDGYATRCKECRRQIALEAYHSRS